MTCSPFLLEAISKIADHGFRLVPPMIMPYGTNIGGIEPVEIGKMSDFIFYGLTGQQAQQPVSREHFKEAQNEVIGR